jgi:hypothetical protein
VTQGHHPSSYIYEPIDTTPPHRSLEVPLKLRHVVLPDEHCAPLLRQRVCLVLGIGVFLEVGHRLARCREAVGEIVLRVGGVHLVAYEAPQDLVHVHEAIWVQPRGIARRVCDRPHAVAPRIVAVLDLVFPGLVIVLALDVVRPAHVASPLDPTSLILRNAVEQVVVPQDEAPGRDDHPHRVVDDVERVFRRLAESELLCGFLGFWVDSRVEARHLLREEV